MVPQSLTILLHWWMIPALITLALFITYALVVRNDKKVQPTNDAVAGLFDMIDGVAGLVLGMIFVIADLLVWGVYFAVMYFTK